ncbi:MAG: class A beta-lactamase-related serine hydrolase [Chloroflexi bacterium]|nr:class A beta-lactamase-related serine hydrolase [Chloroflexota bacterium]
MLTRRAWRKVRWQRSRGGTPLIPRPIGRRRVLALGAASALLPVLAGSATTMPAAADTTTTAPEHDFPIENGRHYPQASDEAGHGYEIRNVGDVTWWDSYRGLGGLPVLGPPRSAVFAAGGFEYQALRYGLLQSKAGEGRVVLANALEIMDRAGHTDWLYAARQVPRPIEHDGSTSFQHAVEIRTGWLTDDAIRGVFESNPDPIGRLVWTADHARDRWGLPMSRPERHGPFVAQRFQRGVLQHWIDEVEGLPAPGSVTTVLLDEVLQEVGVMPESALASVDSAEAVSLAAGNTVGDQLEAAINGRLAAEPGNWSVYAAPSGSDAEVAINADTVVRAASLWKLPLLVEAYRQRTVIGLDFNSMLEMNESVLERVAPPATLAPGQRLTIERALERTMTFSDNSAAVLLGDHIGYANIQWTLGQLGLTATDVFTTHPVTTAREAARLLEVALGMRPAHWPRTLADVQGMRTLLLGETRNNRIPAQLPEGAAVAHKTGDLAGISNDAGVVYLSTGPLTIVILAHDVPGHGRAEATAAEIASMVVGAYDPQTVSSSSPAG